ncbi:MAG: NAD(P)H-binding protein [Burkholderiales bacterium]|nr:NAD(P)H-binding protein [Burkholderiales bacterium]
MSTFPTLAVYGASGHTGRFVVQEAQRRGLAVVAVGRDAARLAAAAPGAVAWREARLDEPERLAAAFAGCAMVIHTAGPFMDTAEPVARAALQAGCHCIDVTAEQPSALATLAHLDGPARAAGRVVMPAAGFYGGLADLLATALVRAGSPVDEITVATALDHWWPTEGTRLTGARNTAPRQVVEQGRLVALGTVADAPEWSFGAPLGHQSMVALPFSEVVTLHHHLPVRRIRSLINRRALEDVRGPDTPPPTAVDAVGRSAQRFEMVVQVRQAGEVREARARGQDIYAVTAPLVVEAAVRLLAADPGPAGAQVLGQAVDARAMLQALHCRQALDVALDVLR